MGQQTVWTSSKRELKETELISVPPSFFFYFSCLLSHLFLPSFTSKKEGGTEINFVSFHSIQDKSQTDEPLLRLQISEKKSVWSEEGARQMAVRSGHD